jgi:hypothetical protein
MALTRSQYEFLRRLDGRTTVRRAFAETAQAGEPPSDVEEVLRAGFPKGLLADTEGKLASALIPKTLSERLKARVGGIIHALWRKPLGAEKPLNILWLLLHWPARFFAHPIVLGFAALIFMAGSFLIRHMYRIGISGSVPEGLTVVLAAVIFVAALWLASALVELFSVSAIPREKSGRRIHWRWTLRLGLPMISVQCKWDRCLNWQTAARYRFSGLALLSLLGFPGILAVSVSPDSVALRLLKPALFAVYIVIFLQLSPWWHCAFKDSLDHGFGGLRFPRGAWRYLWRQLIPDMLKKPLPTRREFGLFLCGTYVAFWTVFALRLVAGVFRKQGVLLTGDAFNAGLPLVPWLLLLLFAAVLVFVLAALAAVVLAGVLKGLKWSFHALLR